MPVSQEISSHIPYLRRFSRALTGTQSGGDAYVLAVTLVEVDVRALAGGFRTSKLLGKAVHNEKDEKIGTLDDIIITTNGKLVAILQVGGFLGLGGHLIATPYESLNISNDGRKITLAGASKEALGKLPEFEYKK